MTREERIIRVVSDAPESAKKCLREAFSGSASPRAAIRAMCLSCTGFDRAAIRNCSAWGCPLWAYRGFRDREAGNG